MQHAASGLDVCSIKRLDAWAERLSVPPMILTSLDPHARRARLVALAGVLVGTLLIWGSLAGLNSWVLGFNAWPERDVASIGRVVMADAPSPSIERVVLPAGALPVIGDAGLTAAQGGLPGPTAGDGSRRTETRLQSGDVTNPQGTAPAPASRSRRRRRRPRRRRRRRSPTATATACRTRGRSATA